MAPRVLALLGANTYSVNPQPKSGRMIRSPRDVDRKIQIASATSCSPCERLIPPRPLTRMGNFQPVPRMPRLVMVSISYQDGRLAAQHLPDGVAFVLLGGIKHAHDPLPLGFDRTAEGDELHFFPENAAYYASSCAGFIPSCVLYL